MASILARMDHIAREPSGPCTTAELHARFGRRRTQEMVASGELVRLRRGLYASPHLAAPIRQAIAVGGRVTCVSAAEQFGLWTPPDPGLHVHLPRDRSRIRDINGRRPVTSPSAGLIRHWWSIDDEPTATSTSIWDALAHVLRCQPREVSVAVLDSAVHLGVITSKDACRAIRGAPHRTGLAESDLDGRAESGIESLVRLALHDAGLRVDVQVVVPGVGRVDLLVEGRVVVEVDGRRWHHNQQARDYPRDLELIRHGFVVVRVDYAQVLGDLLGVVLAVRRASSAAHRPDVSQLLRSR